MRNLIFGFMLLAGAGAAQEFEGVVNIKMHAGAEPMNMVYQIKGQRTRMEMNGPQGPAVVLMDMSAGSVTTLMPQMKMYMSMDLANIAGRTTPSGTGTLPKLTATGKKETVAGHSCEHWLVGDQQDVDMCLAKGLGYFGMGQGPGRGGLSDALKLFSRDPKTAAQIAADPQWSKLMEGGAFPMKISRIENGVARPMMEVTGVERRKIDDSLFNVPSDYREMKMPKLPPAGPK
jgi:hypothetical protein